MPETFDQLVTVLRAFQTKDPNGKSDEIPMFGGMFTGQSHMVNWIVNNWQYLFNSSTPFVRNKDGSLYFAYTTMSTARA